MNSETVRRHNLFLYFIFIGIAVYYLYSPQHNKMVQIFYYPEVDKFIYFFIYLSCFITTKIQLSILIKPFSFCLPSHRDISYKTVLVVGVMATLLFSLIIILKYHASIDSVIYILTILFLVISICLFGSYQAAISRPESLDSFVLGIIIITIFGILSDMFWQYIGSSTGNLVIFYTIPLALIATVLFYRISKLFIATDLQRRYFTKDTVSYWGVTDPAQWEEKKIAIQLHDDVKNVDYMDSFFITKIATRPSCSISRSVIGAIYLMTERFRCQSFISVTFKMGLSSLFIFLLGYLNNQYKIKPSPVYFLYFMILTISCILVLSIFKLPSNSLFLPAGRTIEYRSNLMLMFLKMIPMIIWFLILFIAAQVLYSCMHELNFWSINLSFTPFKLYLLFWPLFIIPVADIFSIINGPLYSLEDKIGISVICYLLMGVYFSITMMLDNIIINILVLSLTILIVNAMYLSMLHNYWFRRDHV